MFKHQHPYSPFIPEGTTKLIVGTLPPPRFTTGELKEGDVDFCYGSKDGQLWQIISEIFEVKLITEDENEAIKQRKQILETHHIGICDMVDCAYREKIDASDLGIRQPKLRPIISILKKHKTIKRILFTGGNSKNGPEYFFRKRLTHFPDLKYTLVNVETPKIHELRLGKRIIETVSLTAPSGSANRAIGSMALYKKMKDENPNLTTVDFRVMQYRPFFVEEL